jgi:hypothetical protein
LFFKTIQAKEPRARLETAVNISHRRKKMSSPRRHRWVKI